MQVVGSIKIKNMVGFVLDICCASVHCLSYVLAAAFSNFNFFSCRNALSGRKSRISLAMGYRYRLSTVRSVPLC